MTQMQMVKAYWLQPKALFFFFGMQLINCRVGEEVKGIMDRCENVGPQSRHCYRPEMYDVINSNQCYQMDFCL